MDAYLEYGCLAIAAAVTVASYIQLSNLRNESSLRRITERVAKNSGQTINNDGTLRRIPRPLQELAEAGWQAAIDQYVAKLEQREKLIGDANRKFGYFLLLVYGGSLVTLTLASTGLLFGAQFVFGVAEMNAASATVSQNFSEILSRFTDAPCPSLDSPTRNEIVQAASIVHQLCLNTALSALPIFLLAWFRRPSVYGESLREVRSELATYREKGAVALKELLLTRAVEDAVDIEKVFSKKKSI